MYVTTPGTSGGQQQVAYVQAVPGASYPTGQPSYQSAQGDKPIEAGQPALEPSVQPNAPPACTEKGQAYW